ncbi:C6 transcription factor [Colletotrichum chrysophilum]|uniref:C6 transcription factor n=1 Tax=Colletotrichum chrysophilum TaxID=1836956 RepID=A0AAD9EFH2_9PEZI|nr:C6 transcription factor [Colletotrichum chrysophilum]
MTSEVEASMSRKRLRNGCLTCRDRKKKCDQVYPICGACSRLNFICRREDLKQPRKRGRPRKSVPQDPSAEPRGPSASLTTKTPDISAFWLQHGSAQIPEDFAAQRRVVLRYYTQTLAALITTNLENNCFISVFLPLAMDSPAFLDTIIAWSSTHLAQLEASYERLALQCRGRALRSLSTLISSAKREPEIEMACCLVQCALESISGDTKQWWTHLTGANEVMRSVCHKGDATWDTSPFSSFEGQWLLRSFAYHDIMAAVAADTRPLLVAGHYWFFGQREPPDSLFGVGSRLLFLISETSVLNAHMIQSHLQEEFIKSAFRERALRLEEELLTEFQTKAPSLAQGIIERLRKIPHKSLVESSLLFPLFICGGEISHPGDIEAIRTKMKSIVVSRNLYNYDCALRVLEEVWQLRLSKKEVDWRDVLDRRQWKLSIV